MNNKKTKKYIAKNIIISLDFDGVIGHGIEVKKKYAKEWFGVELELHQTKKEGFEDLMKSLGKKETNYRSLMDRIAEEHTSEYKMLEGTRTVLKSLYRQGFRFDIITSRNNHDYPYAKQFVKEKLGYLIKNTHNTRNEPKDEFVKKIRPRIHMDDDITKLTELEMEATNKLYFRQPENKHINFSEFSNYNFKEINKWDEFHEYCIEMKEQHEAICWKYDIENKWNNTERILNKIESKTKKENKEIIKDYQEMREKYIQEIYNNYIGVKNSI